MAAATAANHYQQKAAAIDTTENLPKFNQIFFPECGTKFVYEYIVSHQKSFKHTIETPWAFPSGFAFCQTPSNRLFVCGGIGDNHTMRRTVEIIPDSLRNFGSDAGDHLIESHVLKEPMNYHHIDHSVCFLDDKYLIATGSYIQDENTHQTCERYDVVKDRWAKYPPMTVGRCHHSSLAIEAKYVFVICGLVIVRTEKEIVSEEDNGMLIIKEEFNWQASNTIERMDSSKKLEGWMPLNIPESILTPRRNPGVVQTSQNEILIFGGSV